MLELLFRINGKVERIVRVHNVCEHHPEDHPHDCKYAVTVDINGNLTEITKDLRHFRPDGMFRLAKLVFDKLENFDNPPDAKQRSVWQIWSDEIHGK